MAALHPEIVHFAIALLIVGVLFRAISLLGRPAFVGPAATTLLALGTIAAIAAAFSGDAAHAPVEQMPGLRQIVGEHEEWGEWTRNIFLVVLVIEVVLLAMPRWPKRRYVQMGSLAVGLVGLFCLFEAGEHGGQIVYAYAGGIGTRGGSVDDVRRLLLAGLYQQALVDRQAGRAADAAALIDEAAMRYPDDIEVRLLRAESLLVDRKDAGQAIALLRSISPPADNRALRIRHGLLTADALNAAGQRDGAIATLQQIQAQFPSPRVQQRLDALQGKPAAPAR
jgi:uncharacterized membrane protein